MDSKIHLTPTQSRALAGITAFLADEDPTAKVFLLKGYAGTGKTTLVKFVVEHLRKQNQQVCLMASTARAAAVLSSKVGYGASTIHSLIYQYKSFNKDIDKIISNKTKRQDIGQLYLMFEPRTIDKDKEISANCVYIIDEASMISDYVENNPTQAKFGSGRLLTELLAYDTRKGSKFIFVGDPFLNAMRCTYGYAVTCHKAQGGEWDSAYVQMQRNVTLNPTKGKYQWLYTAITRAKSTVHVARDFFVV